MTGFAIFDKDNDGYITKSEFHGVAGPKFSFEMLDADGDGKITRAEYEAAFKVYIQEQL
jgi:Ca2+-binding EF-hand superfamily protein